MKKIIFSVITMLVIAPMLALTVVPVFAQTVNLEEDLFNTAEFNIQEKSGLGNKDPRTIAANVINILLGFLGIIAVVLVLAGGFMWMTAAGNEDKVAQAKQVMSAGIIGLIIVLAAFGIAKFVVDALINAT